MATPAWIVATVWMLMCFCSAEVGAAQLRPGEVQCRVTENKTGTFYSVQEFEGHNCTVTWSNGTGFTMAFEKEGDEKQVVKKGRDKKQVVSSTNRTLEMRECWRLMHYNRTCNSDGIKITATCTSNCTGIHPSKLDGGNSTEIHPSEGGAPLWLVQVLVAVLVPVLAGVVVILLLLRVFVFKNWCQKPSDAGNKNNAEEGINMSFLQVSA